MDLPNVVDAILDHIETIDYSETNTTVSLFETTIRYLAGMLSGYDLLTGPKAHLCPDRHRVRSLLKQSEALADNLKYAFHTPSGVPHNNLYFQNRSTDNSNTNGLAVTGTLVLEWTRLSDLLGDDQYAYLSQLAESYLLHPAPRSSEPFPGLVGSKIYISNGTFADSNGGWSGGTDSFYEYLLKMFIYDPARFASYKDRWIVAADSTMRYLASHPKSRPDLTFLAEYKGMNLTLTSGHLTCFDGGNFILGGLVLDEPKYVHFGLSLVEGCHETYTATLTGIGPERFGWSNSSVPADQREFYRENGFYITSSDYVLRPEVIESIYYAYRATGNPVYRDWAWDAFKAINSTCRTDSGFTSIEDVNAVDGGEPSDNQESFLFAEVMKYLYLIFAEDEEWQVNHHGKNFWVFNTEAHPFQVAGWPI
ncbi:hypothetical protein BDY21DRAFT_340773 [Lineolata rhizophorae]|uniref:alpha-1,2-Mannosidase n=1 Tax=Lineolata rhizophorae TaxID=578093 RepID=A0A6A6P3L3_9PEZI|nr:hypothetical protein BDY21DRAFT_340773 [Lineolata rhizophorae]